MATVTLDRQIDVFTLLLSARGNIMHAYIRNAVTKE
jgi:hypothetical protein